MRVKCCSALLLSVALVISACGSGVHKPATALSKATVPAQGPDQPPTSTDVMAGRYTRSAELDDGAFRVSRAPLADTPSVSQHEAAILFGSDAEAKYYPSGNLLGFGLVSVQPGLGVNLSQIPAWVGLASGVSSSCGEQTASTDPTTTVAPPPTSGYLAVIMIDSRHVYDYESRTSLCGGLSPATAKSADELLAVPWQELSLTSSEDTVRYQAPSCVPKAFSGAWLGGEPVSNGQDTLTVVIKIPFDVPSCAPIWQTFNMPIAEPQPSGPPFPHYTSITPGSTGPVGGFQPR